MEKGVHRFLRIPAAQKALVRELLDVIAEPVESTKDMFSAGYSATGIAPATHHISSGLIDEKFASIIGNANITWAVYQQRCAKLGRPVATTLLEIQTLYSLTDVRTDALGFESTVLNLLGMKPVAGVQI